MRRILILALVLALAAGLCPLLPAQAEGTAEAPADGEEQMTCGGYTYVLREDGGAEVIFYRGPAGEILIPDELDGHPVLDVRYNPFTELTAPYTVRVSGDHPSLCTVEGVLFLKTGQRLVCCPTGLHLRRYDVPPITAEIGGGAFLGCGELADVTIPDGVTALGYGAFYGCRSLTLLNLPDSVAQIGDAAFCYCSALREIRLPEGLESIGYGVFFGCVSLRFLTIPDSVAEIGREAFKGCSGLIDVKLPAGLKKVEDFAFQDCTSLREAVFPEGTERVGHWAFLGCGALRRVSLPRSLTEFGANPFGGCDSLRSVGLAEDHPAFTLDDGALYSLDGETLVLALAALTGECFAVPEGTRALGEGAFYGCGELRELDLPGSLETIGFWSVGACPALTAVTIPAGVTKIDAYAFTDCPNLTLTVYEGTPGEAFCREQGLRPVVIPAAEGSAESDLP